MFSTTGIILYRIMLLQRVKLAKYIPGERRDVEMSSCHRFWIKYFQKK